MTPAHTLVFEEEPGINLALQQQLESLGYTVPETLAIGKTVAAQINQLERRLQEKESCLRAAQARLAGILATAEDAIISTDENQQIVLFNSGAEKIFGYTAKEIVDRPLDLLLPQRFHKRHHQHIAEFVNSPELSRSIEKRSRLIGRRRNGSEFQCEASIAKLHHEGRTILTVILRDVTHRKQLETRLDAIHQLGQELTLIHDENAIIERVLKTAAETLNWEIAFCGLVDEQASLLRYTYQLVDGVMTNMLWEIPLEDEQIICQVVVHNGRPISIPDTHREQRYVAFPGVDLRSQLCVPIKVNGQVLGVLNGGSRSPMWFTDNDLQLLQTLADQVAIAIKNAQLYKEIQKQLHRIQESQAQLIQSEKVGALGRLAASVSHEINNPLQAIHTCVNLMQEDLAASNYESLKRYLDVIANEIERVAGIVTQMRDFYRPAEKEPEIVDIYEILANVLLLTKKKMEHSEVTLKFEWAEDQPLVKANAAHLKQVFLNLILNALDAMPNGGELHISTWLDEIYWSDQDHPQPAVRIAVRDTGQGIPPEIRERLFEPFFTTKKEGTGLGLTVSHGIIVAHGGQMFVDSKIGRGATFSILLPGVK